MERDDGTLYVLEAIIIALLLLGAAYGVGTLKSSSLDQERPRSSLSKTAHDALVVLGGLDGGNGTLLDAFLREAIHCARDAVPSTTECDGKRADNLSFRLDNYLPKGAGWAISINNGVGVQEIYRSPLPQREAVASQQTLSPGWNGSFLASELSCYDNAMDVNVTLIPIDRAALASAWVANASWNGLNGTVSAAATPKWWNLTYASGVRPASGTIVANLSARAALEGATRVEACDLHGSGNAIIAALRDASFGPASASVPIGSSVAFSADLSGVDALAGVTVRSANVTIYEPIGGRRAEPDTWIVASTLELTGSPLAGTWTPSASSFYGQHVAMLRADLDVGGTTVEARRLAVIGVALPTGELPVDPPYRVQLQAWMGDWS